MKRPFELTEANYHSLDMNRRYFSASQIKQFYSCEARAMAQIRGEWVQEDTTSLLVGSYVDAWFSAKRSQDGQGEASGKEFLQFLEENAKKIRNSRTGELKADFKQAELMIGRAEQDPLFMEYMRGNHQVIMTANLFGMPFKAKFDVVCDSYRCTDKRIVDLKTVKDFKPLYREGEGRLSFVEYWRYDLQMAIYQEIYFQNKGLRLPMYLACITKEVPPDIAVIHIPQEQLDMNMELLKKDFDRFRVVKAGILEPHRCENCAYCRATKKLKAPISMADLNDFE